MSRMRSFSFPRIATPKQQDDNMTSADSQYRPSPTHSRSSSGASTTSSPIASTFSTRSHNRWPSSSSSLASAPDSPLNVVAKSALHDVVEDPAERDDAVFDLPTSPPDEPLCICDTPFCEHRPTPRVSRALGTTSVSPEWSPGDDYFSDGELPGTRLFKHRRSGDLTNDSLSSRLSRHWPSMSARWRDRKPTTSTSPVKVQSAPPSRSSSMRMSSLRHSLAIHVESAQAMTPPITPVDVVPEVNKLSRPRGISRPQKPLDIVIPDTNDDPIDRQELSSTPLLPPVMSDLFGHSQEVLQSPLQSPSVAAVGSTTSLAGTPSMTPTHTALPTPPLSSQPSVASFGVARSSHASPPSTDIPAMSIAEETDPWAVKLGHANFRIYPAPYFPGVCDFQSCKRLLDDWEAARMEYMRQLAHVNEHYGPNSQTYKLTEQKWAEIDAQWRDFHEQANNEAGVSADTALYQPLAETQPLSKMPSLNDPQQPTKFPKVDEADIVGPMVTYAKIQRRPSRKPTLLKLFTDPASLLGGRSPFGMRR